MLQLVRGGIASTRAELMSVTGLARSTVSQRVDALVSRDLLRVRADSIPTRGRPPQRLHFNEQAGIVVAALLGTTRVDFAVTDLVGTPLAVATEAFDIEAGPPSVVPWLEDHLEALADAHANVGPLLAIGIGVPGPVEFASGTPTRPPIMPGWDGFPLAERVRTRFGTFVLVDNDANLMAYAERCCEWPGTDHLLFVSVGDGIGAGLISHGRLFRGAQGVAGDIGHVHVEHDSAIRCRCGNSGCLEALAGGTALAARLSDGEVSAANARDVVALFRGGHPRAVTEIRAAGRLIGQVLAASVNAFNPAVIVIGGELAQAEGPLLAGIREIVYQRALPLGTHSLRIVPSILGDQCGVRGAALLAIEHILRPDAVDRMLFSP